MKCFNKNLTSRLKTLVFSSFMPLSKQSFMTGSSPLPTGRQARTMEIDSHLYPPPPGEMG
jgi:hypothetical protein